MRTVREFWENNYGENLRMYWVNFENMINLRKIFCKLPKILENLKISVKYWSILELVGNFKYSRNFEQT